MSSPYKALYTLCYFTIFIFKKKVIYRKNVILKMRSFAVLRMTALKKTLVIILRTVYYILIS